MKDVYTIANQGEWKVLITYKYRWNVTTAEILVARRVLSAENLRDKAHLGPRFSTDWRNEGMA
jgi:hypothetical protein